VHDLFVNAVFAQPSVCLGQQLKPLSLAHAHVLMAFGSPYVTKGAPTLGDLAVAVWICSRDCYPFAGVADAVRDPRLERQAKKWGRRSGKDALAGDSAVFVDYIKTGLHLPPRQIDPGKARLQRVPWTVSAVCALMRNGLTRDEAWTVPMAEACMYRLGFDFLDGDDSLQSEEEREAGFVTVKKREDAPTDGESNTQI